MRLFCDLFSSSLAGEILSSSLQQVCEFQSVVGRNLILHRKLPLQGYGATSKRKGRDEEPPNGIKCSATDKACEEGKVQCTAVHCGRAINLSAKWLGEKGGV